MLGVLIAAAFVLCFSSCVNEEYDVSDVNTEITLGSQSVTLPIGTTKQLTLKSLMAGMDQEMLQVLDGGYAFRLGDNLSLGDQLPDMKDMLNIPDVVFEQSTVYNLSGIDQESMSIDAQKFSYDFDVADDGLSSDIELPQVSMESKNSTGLWKHGESARGMKIDLNDVSLSTKPLFALPSLPSGLTGTVPVDDFPSTDIEAVDNVVTVQSQAPSGISNISDVLMSDDAAMVIELSVTHSYLASGNIVPDLTLDLGGLAVLGDGKGQIDINQDFILSADNDYSVTKKISIKEIPIKESDWNSDGELSFDKTVQVYGSAALTDVVVDLAKVAGYTADGMGLSVAVSFEDMGIKSLMMDFEVDPVVEKMTIPVTINEMSLPDGVKSINKVVFTEDSVLDMLIETHNLDIQGLEIDLESFKMTFPESMKVEGAVDGVWELSDVSIRDGYENKLHVEEFVLPAPVDGKISYSADVELEATIKLGGRICSADVPYEEDQDGRIEVSAVSSFNLEDYFAEVEGVSHTLDLEPEEFSYSLPDDIADYGTFIIIPEGNPVLEVNINIPKTKLALQAGAEGLKISFPEFLKFDTAGYDFDDQTNTLTLKGLLPDVISLPVKQLVVTPVKNEETGEYMAGGEIVVAGAIEMDAGEISGKDIDLLMESEASVSAVIPKLVAAEISFEKFEMETSEQFEFTLLAGGDLPEQVKSVSEIQLDDVDVQIEIAVEDMPDFGSLPELDFQLELPEILVLDDSDSRVEGNKVAINGVIKDGKVDIKPIALKAIDLSGFDLTSGEDLVASMSINGGISVEKPQVDLKELSGDVKIDVKAAIEDIEIAQVEAVVDYQIEGINETFKISGLPEFMKGDDFVIDLANPHLVIKAKTNMGIPVSGNLSIIPLIGGVENTDARIDATIKLPYTDSAEKTDSVVLWFGADKGSCPADYTFIEADVNKLIRQIPDELKLQLSAGTESDKACILDPSAEYDLGVSYDFVVPMAFGEDLHIELSDTMAIASPILSQMLEKNSVQLAGSVTSSLPVQLELNVELLDDNNQAIPMSVAAKQKISAGNSDGSAAVSPLDFTLDLADGASATNLSGIKLTFVVSAPNSTGRPIGENDFVQADLKIAAPEGVTLDLEELM